MTESNGSKADLHQGDRVIPLSIVIPAFNHVELTRECIKSIREYTPGDYEIIVVDNGSTDGTAEYLRDIDVHVITNAENLGFPRAANQGIREARGLYLCLLNNDVVLLEGWLEPLLESLDRDPEVGIAGPKQVNPERTIWHAGTAFGDSKSSGYSRQPLHIYLGYPEDDPAVNVERCYPAMNFGCCLIRAGLFDEVGLLDEETFVFPGSYEDVDWCLRARKKGYLCVYRPDSKVVHLGSQTLFHTGESLREKGLEASRTNLEHLLEKWRGEPESFFVPDEVRPLADDYFGSSVFLDKENAELRLQLSEATDYIMELEVAVERAHGDHREAAAYARRVEAEWQEKCEQLQTAERRIAELEAEKAAMKTSPAKHVRNGNVT